jgi:hypothetical protein
MSEGDFEMWPPEQAERAGRVGETWGLRAKLRDAGREKRALEAENAELRRRVERLEPVDYGRRSEPETPAADPGGAEQPDQADPRAELEQLQQARAAAEAAAAELSRQPVGIPPEAQRAMQLDRQAEAGATPPTQGLEGILSRLQDRSVPYPQLLEEMRSMGFRDDQPGG